MNELNELTNNILNNHYKGEWDDSQVYDAIQDMIRSTGGKLYKYHRFDQTGYSLKSLQKQEMYCSKPSKFNDPFDCRIGIDINDLAKNLFAPVEQIIEDSSRDYKAVFRKEKELDACSATTQSVIEPLLKNADFCELIEQCNNQQLTDAQLVSLLQQNPAETSFLITILIKLALGQTHLSENGISVEPFVNIINALDANQLVTNSDEIDIVASFFEACDIPDDVDQISLTKQMFQMVQPEKSNELDRMDEQFYLLDENLRERIDQHFYVGCLSENHDNVLMWSHYGESHTGFCIEYDFNRISLKDEKLLIFPVFYSEKRPPIPWNIAISKTDDEMKRSEYDFILSMLTKASAWSYEKEWRILSSIEYQSEMVSLPIVSCVYIGANCAQENKDKILEIALTLKIPVRQMVVDRGIYKLHALPL